MVQYKTSDQYLTSGKVSTRSIHGFKRYRLLEILTKNFNILNNTDADANSDAVVTAVALPVLSYRRAKKLISMVIQRQKSWCFSKLTVQILKICKKSSFLKIHIPISHYSEDQDKTNKTTPAPSNDLISLGICPVTSVFPVHFWVAKDSNLLQAYSEEW